MKKLKLSLLLIGITTSFTLIGCFGSRVKNVEAPRDTVKGKQQPVETKEVPADKNVALNDPKFSEKWGLIQSDASRAWELSKGSREIIVAVIDTGLDLKHEDLSQNLWVNRGETGLDEQGRDKRTNGIDDDGNGFIDDVHGWNFISQRHDLTDNHGHGTHISGIIGAEGDNNKGITGVAPQVQLMTLKYYDPKVPNSDNLGNTIKAIEYATKMGAHIINYSGGGLEYSEAEFQAIRAAQKKGILFVAAAGNERSNSDINKYYPADYNLDNIVSVTAIDPSRKVLPSSNYGIETVHIAAPGLNILSTLPNSSYGYMTGTSQATGFVTGAAVVLLAKNRSYGYRDIKRFILATGETEVSLQNKTATARRLNLFKTLAIQDGRMSASGLQKADRGAAGLANVEPQSEAADSNVASMKAFGQSLVDSMNANGSQKN